MIQLSGACSVNRLADSPDPDPATPPTDKPTRANLRYSSADASFYGAMVGAGETYVPAFALACGLGEVVSGLVGSVPLAIGGWLQLASLAIQARVASTQHWILACAIFQGSIFFVLAAFAHQGTIGTPGLMILASLYWASGLATGPAWNTWIGLMVPTAIRSKFFGFRTLAAQAATVLGLLVTGYYLHWTGGAPAMFVVPFVFAGIMRLASVGCLAMHRVPKPPFGDSARLQVRSSAETASATRRLILYLVLTQGAVQLVAPYITPLILYRLDLGYELFVTLTSAAFVTKAISLRLWPQYADRWGARRLLRLGGIGMVIVPLMWLVSWQVAWLFLIQAVTGIATAAYELGFMLMFFETLPQTRRTRVLTFYNVANTSAWCVGSLAGGYWIAHSGGSDAGYLWLLAWSAVLRLLTLLMLVRMPKLSRVHAHLYGLRIIGVRPGSASIESPITASVTDEPEDRDTLASP